MITSLYSNNMIFGYRAGLADNLALINTLTHMQTVGYCTYCGNEDVVIGVTNATRALQAGQYTPVHQFRGKTLIGIPYSSVKLR